MKTSKILHRRVDHQVEIRIWDLPNLKQETSRRDFRFHITIGHWE
jgi:hypothetical protein